MQVPTVAVITRTRDRVRLLRRTVESVLAQSFGDWVLVVVNSGEAAAVEELLREFEVALAGRLQLIQTAGQPLMGAASNLGIRGSQSEFVVLLDDDDTWESDFLEKAVRSLENRPAAKVAGVVTHTFRILEREERGGQVELDREVMNGDLASVNLFELAAVNRFTVNAFLYERAAYEAVGGYREDLPVLDDWEFNLRFLSRFDLIVWPEALANYHIRPEVEAGADANSQIAGASLHQYYESAIINDLLRRDIESGTPGMGMLVGAAAGHRKEIDKLDRLLRKLRQMSTKVGRIDARTKAMKDRESR